jgi:hypothetical protein
MTIELIGTGGANTNLIVPANKKVYFIFNNTSAGQVTVKVSGQTGISVPNGAKIALVSNGTDVGVATNYMAGEPTVPTATFGTNTAQIASTAFVQAALQALHPVGSIYMNATNAANPGVYLGFGTWVAFGAGRVPVGFNAANPLFDAAEETGGSYDATLVNHNHGGTTGTESDNHTHGYSGTTGGGGAHTHTLNIHSFFRASDCCSYVFPQANGSPNSAQLNAISSVGDHTHNFSGTTGGISATHFHGISSEGTSATNANVQPYITVYMWKRTA